ncbi:MAG TPA: zinc ribbon domain-containing protein [Methylococcaceae bacterium]|jgi:hypothetical protein|nr:zinc ribbon domain-containing protein [Methylococcaceae bacterium]
MYCRYCGKQVKDKAIVCTGCGRPVDVPGSLMSTAGKGWGFWMMVALVVASFVFPPVGFVFGVKGLMDAHKKAQASALLTVAIFMSLIWLALILGL